MTCHLLFIVSTGEQQRLFTREQLLDAGVTQERLRWRLGRTWSSPLPGVVLIGDAELDETQRLRAALLYAGPRALLAGSTAAALHGVRRAASRTVHVLVPRDCSARRHRWVHVHRSAVADLRATTRDSLAVTSVRRAVVDAARWCGDDREAEALVIEACQRRLTTTDRLARELERFGRAPGTARARRALVWAEAGAWSVAEADLLRLVAASALLPPPMLNPEARTATGERLTSPDLWFDDVALAVMVHSKEHHLIGDDWERTITSDADLSIAGATVIGIAPTTIARDPASALRRVEQAYAAARSRPRTTNIVVTPRRF